jgi:hypothetical protein
MSKHAEGGKMNVHDIFDTLEEIAAAVIVFVPVTWLAAFVLTHFVSSWTLIGWVLATWLPALVVTALAVLILMLGRLRKWRRL